MTPYPEQTRPRFSHFAHVGTLRSHLTRRLLQTRQSAARVSKEAHQNVLWKLSSAIIPLDASSCLEFITVRRLTLHPRDHQTHYGSHWTEDYHTGKHRMCTSNTRLFGGTTFRQDGVRWMSIDAEKLDKIRGSEVQGKIGVGRTFRIRMPLNSRAQCHFEVEHSVHISSTDMSETIK
jgi:hypothetical protein